MPYAKMLNITIDDKQLIKFLDQAPARGRWAMAEALKATGGHMRKKVQAYIEKGGEGWTPLRPMTQKLKGSKATPLRRLARMVRFRYGRYRGDQRVQIGFLAPGKGGTARFRRQFGTTPEALARKHEKGKRRRVTQKMRRYFASIGYPIRKSTKYITLPARPMIDPVFRKNRREIPRYLERKFFKVFFSKKKPMLGFR